jgi:hypothetical protein
MQWYVGSRRSFLELDDLVIRLVMPGRFQRPLEVRYADTLFVDPTLPVPEPEPCPVVLPRVVSLSTGSQRTANPNTTLLFRKPVQVPPVTRFGSSLPFSAGRARRGEAWIDGVTLGCFGSGAHGPLRRRNIEATPSIAVAFAGLYGATSSPPDKKAKRRPRVPRAAYYAYEPPPRA